MTNGGLLRKGRNKNLGKGSLLFREGSPLGRNLSPLPKEGL